MFNYCATIAQQLHLETLKTKGSAWQPALYEIYCVAFLWTIASPFVNYCISSRDPFHSDPNTPPISVAKTLVRDGETTIKIKFVLVRAGGGQRGQRGKSSPNAVFQAPKEYGWRFPGAKNWQFLQKLAIFVVHWLWFPVRDPILGNFWTVLFSAVLFWLPSFLGKRHDDKILKLQLYCREILLLLRRLLASSETGRIRFRGVRFQIPNSVSYFRPIICVKWRTHRVFRRTHRVCRRTQWVLSSETVLSKQYSATVSY